MTLDDVVGATVLGRPLDPLMHPYWSGRYSDGYSELAGRTGVRPLHRRIVQYMDENPMRYKEGAYYPN